MSRHASRFNPHSLIDPAAEGHGQSIGSNKPRLHRLQYDSVTTRVTTVDLPVMINVYKARIFLIAGGR